MADLAKEIHDLVEELKNDVGTIVADNSRLDQRLTIATVLLSRASSYMDTFRPDQLEKGELDEYDATLYNINDFLKTANNG